MSVTLQMNDGTKIVVPASLRSATAYVILEQGKWFEKEAEFVKLYLRPGMNAIDVGANHGVYALPMAKAVAPEGRVYAYELSPDTCQFLSESQQKNGFQNLHVIGEGIADQRGMGSVNVGTSSELNALAQIGAEGDVVPLTTLDYEQTARHWDQIDFIKIDAEGAEHRVLAGASEFFEKQSPLVMFEVSEDKDGRLRAAFVERGFNLYRLLPGSFILVPVAADAPLDPFELNYFAAKPDRAALLARDSFLVEEETTWQPDDSSRALGLTTISACKFSAGFPNLSLMSAAPSYADALAAVGIWRSDLVNLPQRYAALRFAFDSLQALVAAEPKIFEYLSTFARVAWEYGRRGDALQALMPLASMLTTGTTPKPTAPFWPANPRFDDLRLDGDRHAWHAVGIFEQLETNAFHSSYYGKCGVDLKWLRQRATASPEIHRRAILRAALDGEKVVVSKSLLRDAPDNPNAAIWQTFPSGFSI